MGAAVPREKSGYLDGLFAAAAAWQENEAWQEEYTLTMSGLTQMDVARRLVRSYITYYETDEAPLSFDQPAFLEMPGSPADAPEDQDAPEDSEAWNEQLNRPTVIQETMENIGSAAGMGDCFVAIPEPRFAQEDAPVLRERCACMRSTPIRSTMIWRFAFWKRLWKPCRSR